LSASVNHEVHAIADRAAGLEDRRYLALDGTVAPAMDLEGWVAHVTALDRVFGKGLRAVESAIVVAMVGAGVGGQGAPETAE
jgi:hypothetical protein